jgi:hypothetical protein
MVTKGVMTTLAAGGRFGCSSRAEAVLGLPCGRNGQIGAQVGGHVVLDPPEAKPLENATEPIRELAIHLKIERQARNRGTLHHLALDGEHGAAARHLFLALTQPLDATEVRHDVGQHVAQSTRDLEPRIAFNEQLSAVGHLAAPFRRARDHIAVQFLAVQFPALNCSHDKALLLTQAYASASLQPTSL